MKSRWFLIFLLFVVAFQGHAENIRIGLFAGQEFTKVTFTVKNGTYQVHADSNTVFELKTGDVVDVSLVGSTLSLWFKGAPHRGYRSLTFAAQGIQSEFRVQPVGKQILRVYPGTLTVRPQSQRLQLVNMVDLEKYVSGVIESEAGDGAVLEYYKVQAVISRTYALNNKTRHAAEGYDLCDGTHCQVYHGRPRTVDLAMEATAETRDLVIVDPDINLITAAFHSNCGGRTVDAGDVWSKSLPYLISRPDTFCLVMPHSHWEKTMTTTDWMQYLDSRSFPSADSAEAMCYMPTSKGIYFSDSTHVIPLRTMREDLKLRSTYFTVHQQDEKVVFIGKGFGHGVGLCQEGAMRMAQLGYSFQDIICYYYHNVHIMPRHLMVFFQD